MTFRDPADLDSLRRRLAALEQERDDLEAALTTAVEHGDAIESGLDDMVQRLRDEVRDRMQAESRLEALVTAISQQKNDLELVVRTITEHSDAIDMQWLTRYAEAEQLTRIDGLTRVANRRGFDAAIDHEWQRALRSRQPLSLLMCDIDHFKQYNDSCGHPAGDKCLIAVARLIGEHCRRPADLAARYGGEEFALLLPETDSDGAHELARQLEESLRELALPHPGSPHGRVTLSMGLATMVPAAPAGPWDLVAAADRLLYNAKQAGRNTICRTHEEGHSMPSTVGDFLEIEPSGDTESLLLRFSPSSVPLKQRWRNNGVSADFLGDYVTTFLPSEVDAEASAARQAEVRSAVSFIANELLENAMKYSNAGPGAAVSMHLHLESRGIVFQASNGATAEQAARFRAFVDELRAGDPQEMFIGRLEAGGENGSSGLGLLTILNDYDTALAWRFENGDGGNVVVTTQVRLDVQGGR